MEYRMWIVACRLLFQLREFPSRFVEQPAQLRVDTSLAGHMRAMELAAGIETFEALKDVFTFFYNAVSLISAFTCL